MSKLNTETLKSAIQSVLTGSEENKRKFVETIELQICLKDFDPARDKRVGGSIKLPSIPRKSYTVCILADAAHCEEAKKLGLDFLDVEAMKKMNKNKKLIRKLGKKYDLFIASQSLIPFVPRFLPGLNKMGKFPTPCTPAEKLTEKIEEVKRTIKFASKKDINLGCAVANVGMEADAIRQNTLLTINYIVSQLKKNWSNIKTVVIKSTMGAPQRIFG